MKSRLLASSALALILALAGPARAGDATDWSGAYLGLGFAGTATQGVITTNGYGSADVTRFGAVPTLAAGYNLDSGRFVLGIEGDITPLGFHATGTTVGGVTGDADFDAQMHALITGRVRAGLKADHALLFATAGLAAANGALSTSYSDSGKNVHVTGRMSGIVVGAGAEYALNDTMTLKADALYFRLAPLSGQASGPFSPDHSASLATDGVVVRGGINFRIP